MLSGPGAIQLDEIRPGATADLKHALSNYGHGAKESTDKQLSLAPEEWRVISRNESPIRSLAHLARNARPVLPRLVLAFLPAHGCKYDAPRPRSSRSLPRASTARRAFPLAFRACAIPLWLRPEMVSACWSSWGSRVLLWPLDVLKLRPGNDVPVPVDEVPRRRSTRPGADTEGSAFDARAG